MFERPAIDNLDEAAPVTDQAGALQQPCGHGHGGAAHAEHLREKLLRQRDAGAVDAFVALALCAFENKRQTKLGWDVVARCSNSHERWTANVSLSVKDNRLAWKSQRGTETSDASERR